MSGRKHIFTRFMERVDVDPSGCWIWTGYGIGDGYGGFSIDRKTRIAHRVAYEFFIGSIPPGLTIDHLCRVRRCVNPAHLEAVSIRENVLRGHGPVQDRARQTHCVHGHEFTPENTNIRKNGTRACRICNLRRARETYERKRQQEDAA